MTPHLPDGAPLDDEHGRPMDIATLHEDDLLLDRLARGEEPDDGDAVLSTLARWRATLPGDDPADPVDDDVLAAALAALRPPRRISRVARRSAVLSVAAALAFGTVAAAEQAGPDSPLWPLAQLMFHDRAEARAAVDAAVDSLSAARASIEGGRYDQASRLLDDAAAAVERIGAGADADRLNGDIAVLRARIPAAGGEDTAEQADRVPSSSPSPADPPVPDVPRSVLPSSPAPVPPPTSRVPGPSVAPPLPSSEPGLVDVPPSLVPGGPLLSPKSLTELGGPIGLVR
jgi:hypothetical protein